MNYAMTQWRDMAWTPPQGVEIFVRYLDSESRSILVLMGKMEGDKFMAPLVGGGFRLLTPMSWSPTYP